MSFPAQAEEAVKQVPVQADVHESEKTSLGTGQLKFPSAYNCGTVLKAMPGDGKLIGKHQHVPARNAAVELYLFKLLLSAALR